MTAHWGIVQRKDGRWMARKRVSSQGEHPKIEYVYARTRDDLDRKLARRDGNIGFDGTTIGEWLDFWLEVYQRHEVSWNTHRSKEVCIRVHLKPAIGGVPLGALTETSCRALLNRLQGEGKERSAQVARSVLKQSLDKALDLNLIDENPAAKLKRLRVIPSEMSTLRADDVKLLLQSTHDDPLHALYALAVTMGLRSGELRGLRWGDINLHARTLAVRRQAQTRLGETVLTTVKTTASAATLPIPAPAFEALRRHYEREIRQGRGADSHLVFTADGTPINDRALRRHFKMALARAELPDVRLHDLRHTCASLLVKNKVPMKTVQGVLRHQSFRTTADIYAHLESDMLLEAANVIEEVLA